MFTFLSIILLETYQLRSLLRYTVLSLWLFLHFFVHPFWKLINRFINIYNAILCRWYWFEYLCRWYWFEYIQESFEPQYIHIPTWNGMLNSYKWKKQLNIKCSESLLNKINIYSLNKQDNICRTFTYTANYL